MLFTLCKLLVLFQGRVFHAYCFPLITFCKYRCPADIMKRVVKFPSLSRHDLVLTINVTIP